VRGVSLREDDAAKVKRKWSSIRFDSIDLEIQMFIKGEFRYHKTTVNTTYQERLFDTRCITPVISFRIGTESGTSAGSPKPLTTTCNDIQSCLQQYLVSSAS
jgi:hypothetical protein